MDDFKFKHAASVDDAVSAFGSATEARYLAGGQTLLPVMKQRLAEPSDLISLARVPGLDGIDVDARTISIGAMTRHADVANHAGLKSKIYALALLASGIADPHVRNRGTIGGSLANNDPAADYPAAVLGLDATIVTNKRRIAADDFFQGLFTTALDAGELITKVIFPVPDRAGYLKFPHPASRYALVGVMVSQAGSAVRVAVTGAGAGVFRVPAMEQALAASFTPSAVADIAIDDSDLTSDRFGSASYRAHLISVLAKRAVSAALEDHRS
jgi:carbon-monoxide dehydrogenase medium subunit